MTALGAILAATFCPASLAADVVIPSESRTAVCNGKIYSLDLGHVPESEREAILLGASIEYLFVLDPTCSGAANWVAVLDKSRGSGENGLCREAEVTFNTGYPVRQFTTTRELLKAERRGEITVTPAERVLHYTIVRRLEKWPAMVPVESLRR